MPIITKAQTVATNSTMKILWSDIRPLGVEGRGGTTPRPFYDRLPARAETLVRKPVWNLSRNSAGMCVRFVTDATAHSCALGADRSLALPAKRHRHLCQRLGPLRKTGTAGAGSRSASLIPDE